MAVNARKHESDMIRNLNLYMGVRVVSQQQPEVPRSVDAKYSQVYNGTL